MILLIYILICLILLISNSKVSANKIDVVMTSNNADSDITKMCIKSIIENLIDTGTIYVITPKAEQIKIDNQKFFGNRVKFIDENEYPFTVKDVRNYMIQVVKEKGLYPLNNGESPFEKYLDIKSSWYLQQILKLYAGRVLQLQDFLVLDSDIYWMKPIQFINQTFINETTSKPTIRYNFATSSQYHDSYMKAIERLTGDELYYVDGEVHRGGITHHMVFAKEILDNIFHKAEKKHELPFWKAFLNISALELTCRAPTSSLCGRGSSISEYELFLNHAKMYFPHLISYRPLLWTNGPSPGRLFFPPYTPGKLQSDRQNSNWLHYKKEYGKKKINFCYNLTKLLIFFCFLLALEAFSKQIESDIFSGFDFVAYHLYAKKRYYELNLGNYQLFS